MEGGNFNGFKRDSAQSSDPFSPVERRTSKKSSSNDRYGKIYPESFRETSVRTGNPDTTTENNETLLTHLSTSPRNTLRNMLSESQREFPNVYATNEEDVSACDLSVATAGRSVSAIDDMHSERSQESTIIKSRSRIGSVKHDTDNHSAHKNSEDSVSSIGYPSIIQSPTFRQRLANPIPSVAPSVDATSQLEEGDSAYGNSPILNTDASKILQLMKTTCGRMHGILSFRTSGTGSWVPGYCAINVTTGSLIYQAKGEPALARTLIPDLRGCNVRTFYDLESRSSCLNVSAHSSAIGVQLRPHVNETFDSWLAALLCWQPIRPKGVQNKMPKPQSVAITTRSVPERRRNSESTQKDAAIIRVGRMLLWDRRSASGLHEPRASRKYIPGRKPNGKNSSSSWRKVSCSLQENGHVNICTEQDVTLLHFVQLSQLSRCAIQQLDPSVLQDEYCIAIYPQYTAHAGTDVTTPPIYLSVESRTLFEVWFVLLRAFTIPELYGPETYVPGEDSPRSTTSMSDMFRIERQLSVRLIEARMITIPKEVTEAKKKFSKPITPTKKPQKINPGEYYAEVLLDGEVRAKTAVKPETHTPFWREDFMFYDLPPILSTASVVVKSLSSSQKDWTLVSHGIGAAQTPMNVGSAADVQVSSLDNTTGKVDVHLDDLDPGEQVEKWWPIYDGNDQQVGEMLMKVQLEETVVLMSQDYEPMSQLLHQFTNGLTVHLAQTIPSELKQLSETLLDIFQVSNQASDWIMALVEDEIDGIHKDTTTSRLRYTSRIHSNDSFDNSSERELKVRDLGKSATVEANLLFRGNSLLTKTLDAHMRRLGQQYLEETIGTKLRDINESDADCEVDPNRITRQEDLDRNWKRLVLLTSNVWASIHKSASRCPPELRQIFRHVRACAEDRYGDFLRSVQYSSVSGFLFLRFFCPAILNPKLFGLLKEHPSPRSQRTFTLMAKALQGLANMTNFGSKEAWMEPMNRFIMYHRHEFKDFVDEICAIPSERVPQMMNPSYSTPIQILRRLPPTSREGFPSLPFLIDHPRSFALLVTLWLESAPEDVATNSDTEPVVLKFHELCLDLQKKTIECLNMAEQAEQPNGTHEIKWEEIAEQMEKTNMLDDSADNTPAAEHVNEAAGKNGGYFDAKASAVPLAEPSDHEEDSRLPVDEGNSNASTSWDNTQLAFMQSHLSNPEDSRSSGDGPPPIHYHSTFSLENSDPPAKGRQTSVSRDGPKYRFFDFGRRKGKDRDNSQHSRHDH